MEAVPVGGEDGRPCFIAGPRDNVPRMMATLRRSVGTEGPASAPSQPHHHRVPSTDTLYIPETESPGLTLLS